MKAVVEEKAGVVIDDTDMEIGLHGRIVRSDTSGNIIGRIVGGWMVVVAYAKSPVC